MPALELTREDGAQRSRIPLDEIDPTVIETIEEAWADTVANGPGRYSTPALDGGKDAAERFLAQARSYVYHRGIDKERLALSGNGDKAGHAKFRLELYVKNA